MDEQRMDEPSRDASLARLERLEAREAIRDLAARYAAYVDARDVDNLVGLFAEDVRSALGVWAGPRCASSSSS